jgi:molecular chaperone GrpE
MIEDENVESDHVISVMQKGFSLNDRLVRPAMVIVAK